MRASFSRRKIIVAALLSAKVDDPEVVLAGYAATITSRGGIVVAQVLQRRGVSRDPRPGGSRRMNEPMNAATYFGTGKVEGMAELRRATGAELVVVCARLSPSQLANLNRIIGCRVLDLAILE